MEILIKHLAEHFSAYADVCQSENKLERMEAYRVAANEIRNCLTGSYGWMLDLQKELKIDSNVDKNDGGRWTHS